VLLQVVTLTWDVGGNFNTVRELDTCNLAKS